MCTRKTLAAVMLAALLGGAETLPAQRKASEPKDAKMSPAAKVSPMSLEARRTVVAARGMSSLSPADRWEDALISGNGKMGVLVFGRPLRERVIFNHERFNLPQWRTPPQPPDIAHVMPEVKRLLLAGKYAEGLSLSFAAARKAGHPGLRWTDSYHPGCAMDIVLPDGGEVGQYVRAVDFTTGEATVRWRDGRGDWLRRTFVSRADNVIVQCLTAPSGGKLNCTISLDEKLEKLPRDVSFTRRVTPSLLLLRGRYSPQVSDGGFEVVMRVVVRGGQATARDDRLVVADAREVLLLTRLAWYRNLSDAEKKPVSRDLAALGDDYATLLRRHAEIHGRVFGRVTLDLGGGEDRMLSAEELRAAATADRTYRAYLEKMFDMGRYVFLSSCGDWPPRLTGVWNGSWAPAWRGDFTTDANVNLAVASGNIGNMPEAMEAYFRLIEGIVEDWKVNARKLYGCRGFLAGTRTDGTHNLHTHFDRFPGHFWTAGAQWLIQPFHEHYQVSGDREFLQKRLLPLMKQVVMFYEDFLTETDGDGKYVFVPSYSPENSPSNTGCPAAINATMDIAVCTEALRNLIAVCRELGIEEDGVARWKAMLAKMPPYLVNGDGALKEWSRPHLEDRYNHRHLSHLYPLWPGLQINPDQTPRMFQAARVAARKRGQGNRSAHGLMHMALVATRLKDDQIVRRNLRQILTGDYVYRSMVTSHNPNRIYNVDASCSLPAVVMEMLICSRPGVIELLPALPEEFPAGSIGGICCRNRTTVEFLQWDLNAATARMTLTSHIEQRLTLMVRRGIAAVEAPKPVKVEASPFDRIARRITLPAGRTIQINLKIGS